MAYFRMNSWSRTPNRVKVKEETQKIILQFRFLHWYGSEFVNRRYL